MSKEEPLRVGVLVVPPVQLLDLSPIDLFSMLTEEYLQACQLPAPITSLGTPVKILYIAESGPGSIASLTANAGLQINSGLGDVKPGSIDILMIPGPDPMVIPSKPVLEFVRAHVKSGVTLLTICTGIFVAGHAGVLEGKKATGPRAIVDSMLKKQFPKVKWEKGTRWVIDGNVWTAGGITNGQEMVAAYIRQRWPGPLSETVCALADVGEKRKEYDSSEAATTLWWISNIFKAWVQGLFKSKST